MLTAMLCGEATDSRQVLCVRPSGEAGVNDTALRPKGPAQNIEIS